jgi:hypothetical protein
MRPGKSKYRVGVKIGQLAWCATIDRLAYDIADRMFIDPKSFLIDKAPLWSEADVLQGYTTRRNSCGRSE